MTRDVGRFHTLPWGGGQVTIGKDLAKLIQWRNGQKVLIVVEDKITTITEL